MTQKTDNPGKQASGYGSLFGRDTSGIVTPQSQTKVAPLSYLP
jgi:hypothetical protein